MTAKTWLNLSIGDDDEAPSVEHVDGVDSKRSSYSALTTPMAQALEVPDNSLATVEPDIAAEWHPTKNGDLTPDDVVFGTYRKVWWRDPNTGDEKFAAVRSQTHYQKGSNGKVFVRD